MKVLYLDSKPSNPNHYLSRAVFEALRRHPAVTRAVFADYLTALPAALAEPFDVLFLFDGEEAGNAVVRRLCELIPVRTVWFTEDPYERPVNIRIARDFDIVFSNDADSLSHYPVPAHHLPLAADPGNNHFPAGSVPLRYDLFFAGTAWPNRLQVLRALRERLPDLRSKLVLVSNPVLDRYIDRLRDGFTFTSGISIRNFSAFAAASAVTLVLPRQFSTSDKPDAGSQTPGPRLFEAALAGACQLIDTAAMPVAGALYQDGRDYVGFTTLDECVEQVRALIANRGRRDRIADSARAHTLAAHLYEHRVAAICDHLAPLVAARRAPAAVAAPKPRRVLFVAHNIVQHGHFGGSEIYLEEIRKTLDPARFEPFFLVHDRRIDHGRNYLLLDRDLNPVERYSPAHPFSDGMLVHGELENFFQRVLATLGIEIVHFNHVIGQPFSLFMVAKAFGARVVLTLHDFFAVCEQFNLLDQDGRYCDIARRPEATCDLCLTRGRGLAPGSQARRRRFLREALGHADLLIAGSRSSAEIVEALYPATAGRTRLMPPPVAWAPRLAQAPADGPLVVGLLGNFSPQKGAELAMAVFRQARGRPVEFHLFGRVDPAVADRLAEHERVNVTAHGPYPSGRIPDAFFRCHVALLLSIWPETYCMALSEAWAAGVVPVVTDLGALGERVRHGIDGMITPPDDAAAIVATLDALAADRALLARLRDGRPQQPFVTVAEYARWLEDGYARLLEGVTARTPLAEMGRALSLEDMGIHVGSAVWAVPVGAPPPPPVAVPELPRPSLTRRFVTAWRHQGLRVALRLSYNKIVSIVRARIYHASLR